MIAKKDKVFVKTAEEKKRINREEKVKFKPNITAKSTNRRVMISANFSVVKFARATNEQ